MEDYIKDFMEENKISKDLEGVLRSFFDFIYDEAYDEGYSRGYNDGYDDFDEEEGGKNA